MSDGIKPGEPVVDQTKGQGRAPGPERGASPRHIRAAASILTKEAKRILRRHRGRLAAEPTVAIEASLAEVERLRGAKEKDWPALEEVTERLDELLHNHAAFARKSALRETLENVTVAVIVALGLRSCIYEPFKIPSGSMMPTLRAGDHIFVNKFVYGIQIPFTNTVVGEGLGAPERGDVIVFRYPIDESEDFIKRVIGLPGDTVAVDGDKVTLRRAGEAEFEVLERTKLAESCHDEAGTRIIDNCELFAETLDGRTHTVRYMTGDARFGLHRRKVQWEVPEGHLLVMGDNRNQSHDSLAWTRTVEAISADGLLTIKDLRDLTTERLYTLARPESAQLQDPGFDHVVYKADHRSATLDLELEVWRQPSLGSAAIYAAAVTTGELAAVDFTELVDEAPRYRQPRNQRARDRLLQASEAIHALSLGDDGQATTAVAHLVDADATLRIRCGNSACREPIDVLERLGRVLDAFEHDHERDARQLLEGDRALRYSQHWTSRNPERFHAQTFVRVAEGRDAALDAEDPARRVRLRAWRHPDEGIDMVTEAALETLGAAPEAITQLAELGENARMVHNETLGAVVFSDPAGLVFLLECGHVRCRLPSETVALAQEIVERVPQATRDRRALGELLTAADLARPSGGSAKSISWRELDPPPPRSRYEYDRIRLEGTIRSREYSVALWTWLRPAQGIPGALEELAAAYGDVAERDDSIRPGGYYARTTAGHAMIFGVPETDVVVQIECRDGICGDRAVAAQIAQRIAAKALDETHFIDRAAERPSPFVPRGHVKGRADRIWLPLSRFWLPIR